MGFEIKKQKKKEVLLVKVSAFLSAKNIDISDFKFAPNGGTIFPSNLSESTAKEYENSDSEDYDEEVEEVLEVQTRRSKPNS